MNTLSIAAYNSSRLSKREADYICDGTSDSEQFAEAFNAISIGGTIELSEGDFLLTESLVYPGKSVSVRGQSVPSLHAENHATKLRFSFDSLADCVAYYPSDIGQSLENVAVLGDGVNTRYGLYLANHCAFKSTRFVSIFEVADSGIWGDSGNSQNYFERVFTTNLERGFLMYGNANVYISCEAIRHEAVGVGGNWGFRTHETGSIYIGCVSERYTTGFHIFDYAMGVTFQGCYAEKCSVSLGINGVPSPRNTRVYGFYSFVAQHESLGAIRVLDSVGTLLSGLLVRDSVSGISLDITQNANTLLVSSGVLDDAQAFVAEPGAVVRIEDVSHQEQWLDWTTT